ncbi:MAG: 4'-phosphopantetheinyl transferase superfamily protein [Clostridia bacterium]|nr:4'-phosphopantetheinyl transferase superfamily protein [Clostridia bacterium]
MTTKVYIASLSAYTDEKITADYELIKDKFISNGRLSERKESLIGRLMLHKALTSLEAGEYKVVYTDNEKPVLESDKGLYFNISHSGDYVVAAISDSEVGCDIQEVRTYNPRVAGRNYCQRETDLIERSLSKDEVFIRLWALKESVLKYTGKGLSGGLSTYDFSPYIAQESFEAFGCSFYVKKIENTYFALCYKASEFKIETTDL